MIKTDSVKEKLRNIEWLIFTLLIISGVGLPLFFSLLHSALNLELHMEMVKNPATNTDRHAFSYSILHLLHEDTGEPDTSLSVLIQTRPDALELQEFVAGIISQEWMNDFLLSALQSAAMYSQGKTDIYEVDLNTAPIKNAAGSINYDQALKLSALIPACSENQDSSILGDCITGDISFRVERLMADLHSYFDQAGDVIVLSAAEIDYQGLRNLRSYYKFSYTSLIIWSALLLIDLLVSLFNNKRSFKRILQAVIINGVFALFIVALLLMTKTIQLSDLSLFNSLWFLRQSQQITQLSKFVGFQFIISYCLLCVIEIAVGLLGLLVIKVVDMNFQKPVNPD